jgi:hypothetical protein
LLLIVGHFLRWGPLVPCFFLGAAVSVFIPAVNRPAYSEVLDCLICGAIGGVVGLAADCCGRGGHRPRAEADAVRRPPRQRE